MSARIKVAASPLAPGFWVWRCTACREYRAEVFHADALAGGLEHLRDVHAPLWEDDGSACTPCSGCTPCPVASKPAGPSPSTPDASEAVRSPHSTSQTPSSTQGEPA